ncbi:hypothetical protein AU252_10370 [Pseudarthrobacter sulfonivorans]|uniref:Uncharacterized protein n=1 Tax=Pseudarthrobacter sulfonivorans TaxID=121292 RepID=A0A0U3NXD9_9MICC|nr:hypothetical protein AU252_10370 [Pseudarthrobacter sulfonivorans]
MFHVKPFGERLGAGRVCSAIPAILTKLDDLLLLEWFCPALAADEAPRMLQTEFTSPQPQPQIRWRAGDITRREL